MSSLYNLEPQPTAKVVLQTTSGDLSLELFAKQTPLASRNFLQHCLDGFYNNTIFHRLVAGFIVQGGDPTGSGSGGISAINNGEPFQDEFHSRLKYTRRGLLGMANEGKDSNGSQFFFTLGPTPELQGKNTMFGRIEGDTIYNLMKMAEAELVEGEGSERPLYPTRITGAEILVNPFNDMVARTKDAPRSREDDGRKQAKKRKKTTAKNVLSFVDEEGQDEMAAPVLKKAKANPNLVKAEGVIRETKSPRVRPKETTSRTETSTKDAEPSVALPEPTVAEVENESEDEVEDQEPAEMITRRKKLEKTNAEIAALKASMKRSVGTTLSSVQEKPKSALEALIPSTSTKGRKRGKITDESGALDMFKAFKQRLEDLPTKDDAVSPNEHQETIAGARNVDQGGHEPGDDEADLCDLHFIVNCQSCQAWHGNQTEGDADMDGDDDPGWMAHSLTFVKDTLGKDLEWKRKMEEIEVIDPLEKARAIKEERRRDRDKSRR